MNPALPSLTKKKKAKEKEKAKVPKVLLLPTQRFPSKFVLRLNFKAPVALCFGCFSFL